MTPVPVRMSAVLVHHRQPSLARTCVASLREAIAHDGLAAAAGAEIVLVDCGSPESDRSALDGIAADVRVDLPDNRGYSGGVNAGMAKARGGVLLLSNVDVEFRPGSLAPLLAAVSDPRVGAAAPVCSWDAADRLLLPPGFDPPFLEELALLRASGSTARDDRRFAAFARDAVRLWTRGGTAPHLSGAVLAARRDVFDRVGRFDERFTFEYEETEWESRVRSAGLRLEVAAAARVRHAWGSRGSKGSAETERRRRESRLRFREARFGRIGRALLERAERRPASGNRDPRRPASWDFPARPGEWLAISPHRSRVPFVGVDLARPFSVPPEIRPFLTSESGDWFASFFSAADGRPRPSPLETERSA